ncbi:transcription factor btd-like [Lecanosticta acicola]|uniref:Transcription factor btd-like n=1 Tax=Lecanosticta acicola TaxID=111012 RepID=A0AAI8Z0E4_9PEZI|nr:transcription factor btd-like [Lecanosticta acicola]
MAMTTRATTPSHPEQFAALEGAPRTPTSISSGSVPPTTTSGAVGKSGLLRPTPSQRAGIAGAELPLSPKSKQARLSPGRAATLTGAAAMAELKRRKQQQQQSQKNSGGESGDRQTSPNPAVAAMQSLMGPGGMSRVADAPAPDKLSEPLREAAEKISVPDNNSQQDSDEVSPASLGSFGTLESTGGASAMTATATANDHTSAPGQQFVAEPSDMADGETYPQNTGNGNLAVPDQNGNKAISYSYPGPPPQPDPNEEGSGPSRGMSLPRYGRGSSPKSPASNKRHRCPYCATDFTRHHNLKSHLLTHTQEKPYVCQTCQARFRRLHDLKRHTKLHTGERPHTCDRCGRKFARGDALARHNKGPGGCAGRRSSFGGDDDDAEGQGESMDGVEYDDGNDEQGRRISEPNRKRQQLETPEDPNRQVYRQPSSTYPPAPTRSMGGSVGGSMGPPQVIHPGSSSVTSPREMSGQRSPAGGSSVGSTYYGSGQVFAEPGVMMTSSPKPLSPGQPPDQHRLSVGDGSNMNRNRSTSLTTQFQQQHFGRQPGSVGGGSVGGSGGARTPPPPNVQNVQFPQNQGVQPNILPPLGSGNQVGSRGPPQMTGGAAPNMHQHPPQQHHPNQGSNPGSLSSHGRSSGSSLRDMTQDPNDIWGYVRQLESRFSRMQDEYELRISRLQEELISLRGQVGQISNAASYSSEMGQPRAY